jgi:peptide/nickel transport system substrate-binding protein
LLLVLLLTACAPSTSSAPSPGAAPGGQPAPGRNQAARQITVAIGAEVNNLAPKLEPGNTFASEFNFMTDSPLTVEDAQGKASPLLAAEMPSQDNGSWKVNPDGTMLTTWKIRPNAVWHDGQPILGSDFAFAFKVYMDPNVPVADRLPEQFMDRVEAVDDRTFNIYWKTAYPWANRLIIRELPPLPEHVVGPIYAQGDAQAFVGNAFWTSNQYVGSGPYRLVQWDPASQLIFQAFDQYFMGRPKTDRVVFRIIGDTNTVLANVLGGNVDVTVGITLSQEGGATARRQWADGHVSVTPVRFRYTQIQFNPDKQGTPALQDVRVRQALVTALDRDAIAEVATAGTSKTANVPIVPQDPLFPRVDQAISKYLYDPTRALQLLQDAGWARGPSGALQNAAGQTLPIDIWTTAGSDNESEQHLMAAGLSQIGVQASETLIAQSRIRDAEYRVSFPALNTTAQSIDVPAILRIWTSLQCPTAASRFGGSNRGCWSDPEFDRWFNIANTSLDPAQRDTGVINALKELTDQVGAFGLSYNSENIAVRNGLVGPGPRWPGQIGTTWNVYQWEWQ